MKIILSRKGVDSSSGGFASPILKEGRLLPVAIPDDRSPIRYRDLLSDVPTGQLVKHLSNNRLNGWSRVHLDPDINKASLSRDAFAPVFGQCGAAQSHLASHGIGPGDLFLFFGWFRHAEYTRRRWRYVTAATDLHVIYGWLQIDSVVPVDEALTKAEYACFRNHPHCFGRFSGQNVLYVGRQKLSLLNDVDGAGLFPNIGNLRTLTAPGYSRSMWRVPGWMHPRGRRSVLSYHQDSGRWRRQGSQTLLQSVARGQEFVLDTHDYPEALDWVVELFSEST